MNHADAEEYTQALSQVMAGGWRQIDLGQRLGVPNALGLSNRDWVEQRLGGYIRLSISERREAVAELAEEGRSTREIADVLGVTHITAARDLAVTNVTEPDTDLPSTVTNVTPEPTDGVVERAIDDAREVQAQLDAMQPDRAGEDLGYMIAWGKVHTKFSHAVLDVLGFDLERVVRLSDDLDAESIQAGIELAEAYKSRLLTALEEKNGRPQSLNHREPQRLR